MTEKLKELSRAILIYINKLLPKFNRVIVQGLPNTESSAISVANYINRHYDMRVYYIVSNREKDNPDSFLSPDIITVDHYRGKVASLKYLLMFMTSKYIFLTHGAFLNVFSDSQTVVNIWHGVLYKKIGVISGEPPILADITVGTSQSTGKMFSEAFAVSENSVYASGYPRNDMLLNAKERKRQLKEKVNGLSAFSKVAIWMPTYRNSARWEGNGNGIEVGNPFYIKDFNVSHFNNLLKKHKALCLVKPHYFAPVYKDAEDLSNMRFIDDRWISQQGITLYQLLGCTDLLISDVSSVIVDYMLLNQPIICMSEDFEAFRKTSGFYFNDIENWIPSRINTTQEMFFNHLEEVLENGTDPFRQKREKLKKYFFDHHDARSTERIVKHALGDVQKWP